MKKRSDKTIAVIIEDDPIYLRMWEKIFSNIPDCRYHITNDPKAALKIIGSQEINLVISDIIMPKGSGYDIAAATHELHPTTDVVLTTAYNCDLSRFDLANPKFSILYKPYRDIDDIQRFITHLLKKEDVFSDVSEDSYSENDVYPNVMEWKL